MLNEIWNALTDKQIAEVEKEYADRVKGLKDEGQDVKDMTAYEALEHYEQDVDDIESLEDIMDILK